MKLFNKLFITIALFFLLATPAFAANNSEIATFTNQTLTTLISLAGLAAVFFLIKGAYGYITSNGKPDGIEHAKLTIRNALIGLVLVLGAGVTSSLFNNAFTTPNVGSSASTIQLQPIVPVTPSNGLTQVLIDAVNGFLQNIVQSATKPLIDSIMSLLTNTPSIINNSVLFNFWLVMIGITNALFALVVAALGFHFMSASSFGFDEIEFKHLLPRIGLAFILANTSIFLCDWIVLSCNALINALLHATGGLDHAWVLNSVGLLQFQTGTWPIITLIFMLLFIILSVVLILLYIVRLITLSLGVVMAPIVFLLWAIPKFSDFAEISIKAFLVTVYTVFVHVVIIQLASAFLAIPEQSGTNPLMSILIAIGLLFTLLKTPSFLMQLVFYNTGRATVKKLGGQIMNVITSKKDPTTQASGSTPREQGANSGGRQAPIKTPRRVVAA